MGMRKWPPPLAWPGLGAMWLVAFGMLAAVAWVSIQLAKDFTGASGLYGFLAGFSAGMIFMAYLAWLSTRGTFIAYFAFLGFVALCGPLTCLSTGETLHWLVVGAVLVLMGVSAPFYVSWAKRRGAETSEGA